MDSAVIHSIATGNGKIFADLCTPVSDLQGFAQVIFSGEFGRYMLEQGMADDLYSDAGVRMEVAGCNFSYEKRKAYAEGYAQILNFYGVRATTDAQVLEDDFDDED